MEKYKSIGIVDIDGCVISLKYIESLQIREDPEDEVVSRLKADVSIIAHTVGGFVHEISVKRVIIDYSKGSIKQPTYEDCIQMAQDIIDQWWAMQRN